MNRWVAPSAQIALMLIAPEKDDSSIVLVGSLNPAIFHPAWFALNEIVGKEEINDAKIDVVHNEVSRFVVRGIAISVDHFRFAASCASLHRERVKDLVLVCFGNLLTQTPVRAMGINRSIHFKCPSEAIRNRVGQKLAPPAPWGTWGQEVLEAQGKSERHGGMIRLMMRQQPRPDEYDGYIGVEVQPSELIKDNSGIHLEINNHFQLTEKNEPVAAERAVEVLEKCWEFSMDKSVEICDQLMLLVERESGAVKK